MCWKDRRVSEAQRASSNLLVWESHLLSCQEGILARFKKSFMKRQMMTWKGQQNTRMNQLQKLPICRKRSKKHRYRREGKAICFRGFRGVRRSSRGRRLIRTTCKAQICWEGWESRSRVTIIPRTLSSQSFSRWAKKGCRCQGQKHWHRPCWCSGAILWYKGLCWGSVDCSKSKD